MQKMKTVELFAGTKSFSNVAKKLGHVIFTVEIDPRFSPHLVADILTLNSRFLPAYPDILWASPPCQGFSVAAIGKNWNHDNTPKTDSARLGIALVKKTIKMIKDRQAKYWFIENPRGKLRKMDFMDELLKTEGGVRHTISYCQYGDTRQKPTDIWTNATWWTPRTMCKPGSTCHEAAPRGSRTGTQGLKGDAERSRIPAALFGEIFSQYQKE